MNLCENCGCDKSLTNDNICPICPGDSKDKYLEELEAALIDVLDGNSAWYDIQGNTGCSEERCKEIQKFFEEVVLSNYKKKYQL